MFVAAESRTSESRERQGKSREVVVRGGAYRLHRRSAACLLSRLEIYI
jgi:hypothetical protein